MTTRDPLQAFDTVRALRFDGERLRLLDQRLLPRQQVWLACEHLEQVIGAIASLQVRGAPAIGIAAAYGLVIAAAAGKDLASAGQALIAARPTAVNLAWAVRRMLALGNHSVAALTAEAIRIEQEDLAANYRMAELGAACIAPNSRVLTICNTGSLACAGLGTALGVIRAGYASGKVQEVFACETRPWLQGARLTMFELLADGIPARLIADSAAAAAIRAFKIDWFIAGADRICANHDTANKIGTFAVATAAKALGAKVMIVAPTSTFDPATADGAAIEIEEREAKEMLELGGVPTAAPGSRVWNPVFDVTPAALIDVILTEQGYLRGRY
jgi:methylthioribose-1-phosphate isomerase